MKTYLNRNYGRLTVIAPAPKQKGRSAWVCQCACGQKVTVLQQSLRADATKSCGCFHRECCTDNLLLQKFGLWIVSGVSSKRANDGSLYWQCKCECGIVRDVSSISLKLGRSLSCGCAKLRKICPHGHDTLAWGRADGMCKACIKNRNLIRQYGITLQEFFEIYEFQQGKCAICGDSLGDIRPGSPGWGNGVRIEVDHEHGTNLPLKQTVRGLLCGGRWKGCNRKLGRIDKGDWLSKAAKYVLDSPARKLFQKVT